jgi:hypothetical protein
LEGQRLPRHRNSMVQEGRHINDDSRHGAGRNCNIPRASITQAFNQMSAPISSTYGSVFFRLTYP